MASVSELRQQLREAELWLAMYAPINNGYGGGSYLNQLIRTEQLQCALNRALKAEGA